MALLVGMAAPAMVALLLLSPFSVSFSLFFFSASLSVSFCMFLSVFFFFIFLLYISGFPLSHPVYLIILLGACNYGWTDGWLKHNWIFLLHAFPKEKLPQWHRNIWKSHGCVANWWGLPHGGRCPAATPWLIPWSVWLAKWKQASHLTVNCDSFLPHFISISLFYATKELMAGEFITTHCLARGINWFFPFLCSDSPPLCLQFYFMVLFVHIQHMLRLLKSANYTEFYLHIYWGSNPRVLSQAECPLTLTSFTLLLLGTKSTVCPSVASSRPSKWPSWTE